MGVIPANAGIQAPLNLLTLLFLYKQEPSISASPQAADPAGGEAGGGGKETFVHF